MASTAKNNACPICRAPVDRRPDNAAFPFCTERCRTIDLGNWLGESYRLGTQEAPGDDGSGESDDAN